ncbi:MAG: hypothetical protein KGJ60_02320 [Verrucomicrobiota bacterium]|nr:hypothetical protein [Verrucomicrobiota bacterium]
MASEFETQFITAADKPALIACSTPAWLEAAREALRTLGYKINGVSAHTDFHSRFSRVRYQVVVIEDIFGADRIEDNDSLRSLQNMPMGHRRHATIFLVGAAFPTLDSMEAFRHSVHAVIGASEMPMLKQLIEKVVAESELFLYNYREAHSRASRL